MSWYYSAGLFLVFAAVVIQTEGKCSFSDLLPRKLTSLAESAKNIIYGNVTAVYPVQEDVSTIEVKVRCTLKGGPFPMAIINVTDDKTDGCNTNDLDVGNSYILFVAIEGDNMYKTDSLNIQSAAHDPNEANFQAVARSGVNSTTDGFTCNDPQPQIACFTTDLTAEECMPDSNGVATKYGLGVMLMAFVFATVL